MNIATEFGHYPPGTTAKELAEEGQLVRAAIHGTLPKGTTVLDLAASEIEEGWTALHAAAENGHLPEGTTAQDLLAVTDDYGTSALHDLDHTSADLDGVNDQIPMVLKNTTTTNMAEIKKIGSILRKKNPTAVALWMAKEMENHNPHKD